MAQAITASGGAALEAAPPQTLAETVSRKRLVFVMIGVMLGMLLGALDQTIVGTAMPHIVAELGGLNHYSWVFTGYLLASTVMVPIYGKLSDIYGRRLFFMGGMVLFLLGSALSGTSQDMNQLIAYRTLQGLGAGALMPIAQAIIGDVFPPSERGKWQGLMMAVFGVATIIGPVAGGWITDNWGWRWVFYVNMPIGAVALLTTGLAMPKVLRKQRKVDVLGAVMLVLAAVPLLLAFSLAGTTTDGVTYNWTSAPIIGMFAVSALFWILFFVRENVAAEPIISPRLFKSRIFSVSAIATFLLSAGMFGAILYLPLFVQGVIGDSATNSGVVLTPMMLGFMASSVIGGQLLSRTGRYKIVALVGFAIATVGMGLLSQMSVTTTENLVIRNMIITGLGIGAEMSLFTIVVQNAFPFRQIGEVTASLQFFRSIGGTIGVAVMGTILTYTFSNSFQSNLPAAIKAVVPPSQLSQLSNPQVLLAPEVTARIQHAFAAFGPQGQALFQQLMEAMRSSLSTAITQLFLLGAGAMLLAFVVTLFLREIPLRKSHEADPTQGHGEQVVEQARARVDMAANPDNAPSTAATASGEAVAAVERPSAMLPALTRAALGLTLAALAREALQPDADPILLDALSNAVDGRYPHAWSTRERGQAVARDLVEPLAVAFLATVSTAASEHTTMASPSSSGAATDSAAAEQVGAVTVTPVDG